MSPVALFGHCKHVCTKWSFAVSLLCLAHHGMRLWRSPRRWPCGATNSVQIRRKSHVSFPHSWGRWPSLIRRNRWLMKLRIALPPLKGCIRRRAAHRACHYTGLPTAPANRNLLQSCPSRLHSPPDCLLRSTWNQTIRYSRDFHENPNVLWGWVDADWAGDTSDKAPTNKIYRRASSEKRLRTRSCHESERLV